MQDKISRNKQGLYHGKCISYWRTSGNLWYIRHYINGKTCGFCIKYWSDGTLLTNEYYAR